MIKNMAAETMLGDGDDREIVLLGQFRRISSPPSTGPMMEPMHDAQAQRSSAGSSDSWR
jgi:hypothetical protein